MTYKIGELVVVNGMIARLMAVSALGTVRTATVVSDEAGRMEVACSALRPYANPAPSAGPGKFPLSPWDEGLRDGLYALTPPTIVGGANPC